MYRVHDLCLVAPRTSCGGETGLADDGGSCSKRDLKVTAIDRVSQFFDLGEIVWSIGSRVRLPG